jgi:choline dehydrogenase-like flavoprotein
LRYREPRISAPLRHLEGTTPGWPIGYAGTWNPGIPAAEALYNGSAARHHRHDPTEPPHSAPYPFAPVPDEPDDRPICAPAFAAQGLHVSGPLPLGIDIDAVAEARAPTTWDAFPCTTRRQDPTPKAAPWPSALRHFPTSRLMTGTQGHPAWRLGHPPRSPGSRSTGAMSARATHDGAHRGLPCAGAILSSALLLASADATTTRRGLANRSDQVGRNFMNHNLTGMVACNPFRRNRTVYEKTIQINDFYLTGGPERRTLGQHPDAGPHHRPDPGGRIRPAAAGCRATSPIIRSTSWRCPRTCPSPTRACCGATGRGGAGLAQDQHPRASDLLVATPEGRRCAGRAGRSLCRAAFPSRKPSHQCGTNRMGADPRTSVVDPNLKAHDLDNLYICDASVLPTSAAVNPSLTIAALALRAGDHHQRKDP